MSKRIALAVLSAVVIGSGTAAAIPWPGDDTGELTLDKAKVKCEIKASKNAAKLVAAIGKCQTKLVDNAFKAKPPIDEQACEAAAEAKFTAKTLTSDCPCVSVAGIIGIVEPVLNANLSLLYCDTLSGVLISSLPDNGAAEITGYVPSTKDILKYQDKVGKLVGKLAAGWLKCHQTMAKNVQAGASPASESIAEEACEAAAITTFNTKVAALTGGQGCEDIASIASLTEAQLDGGNFLTFCESPSGAFVD